MQRRNRAEAMDGPDLDPALLAEDLRNLEALNRFFAGRSVVRRHLARVLEGRRGRGLSGAGESLRPTPASGVVVSPAPPLPRSPAFAPEEAALGRTGVASQKPLKVLDVGSGAGDLCRVVVEECRSAGVPVRVLSLDAHPQIQEYARERLHPKYAEVRFLRGDGRLMPLRDDCVDLALCTLALHHFAEADAVRVLEEMRRVTREWAIVSDLCRSPQAYAGVWLATRLTANPMTRNDGPLSVQRAFTREELEALAERAGWVGARVAPEPWFRMSLVYRKDGRW